MTDVLRTLGQISNEAAQDAAENLQQIADQQNEALKDKENLRLTQSKLETATGSGEPNPATISYGISAAKDSFETSKPDHLLGMLSAPPPKPPVHTLASAMTQSKSAISDYLQGTQSSMSGDLFTVMMAYQKMASKDAREDKKLQRDSAAMERVSAESKLQKDNEAIDQGM